MVSYDVTICTLCGAGYADRIPDQAVFDRYYEQMSKYEHAFRDGKISNVDAVRFSEVVDLVGPHIDKNTRVLDIGCATGGLLAEFKRRGYSNLQGYDPSLACTEAAKRLYGVNVTVSSINRLSDFVEKAGVIVMTGVLEHLADVDSSLETIKGMLSPGGMLYLEVPDASRYDEWFSAPYQFFSMEHVNFFSPASLTNLMSRLGFESVFVKRVKRYIGTKAVEPAIAGLFRYSGLVGEIHHETETHLRLASYIADSKSLEVIIHEKIACLVESQEPLAVWGTGTHTLRLLKTSLLRDSNLVVFLDSNARYQGKTLSGVLIENPKSFNPKEMTILISSHMAQEEIRNMISQDLGWKNKLICLYDNAPEHAIYLK